MNGIAEAFSHNIRLPVKKKLVIPLCRVVLVDCQLRGAARRYPRDEGITSLRSGPTVHQGPSDAITIGARRFS